MSSHLERVQLWQQSLNERRGVKAIAGIAQTDVSRILPLVHAANAVDEVTAIDVAATPEVIQAVRAATYKFVFASSVVPSQLAAALDADADGVELGNYDALYAKGVFISAQDVLSLTDDALKLVGLSTPISVTIPGHLSRDAQVALAKALVAKGITLLQTEGASRALSADPQVHQPSKASQFDLSCLNTEALTAAGVHVMTATGVSHTNVAEAFTAGASAVGVGSAVNTLSTTDEMVEALTLLAQNLPKAVAPSAVSVAG